MFLDEISIEVYGGRGGNGMVSFRREKYVAFGGPSGGNGGKGGDVVFLGDEGMNTLSSLRYQKHIKASNGENGKSKGMHGKGAESIYIKVPLGTIIKKENGQLIGEILYQANELVVAKGGKGGRGNTSFASNRDPAPDYAENGDVGQILKLHLELKILADVGIIGLPNAGKSTLISMISNARPKIADYPFTTITPNIGMVYHNDVDFTVADLPGLIENAHLGDGLGIQFLKHIERCKVLIHLVDGTSETYQDDIKLINHELKNYLVDLSNRPQILVINKIDMIEDENLRLIKKSLSKKTFFTSSFVGTNIKELLDEVINVLQMVPEKEEAKEAISHRDYIFEKSLGLEFEIEVIDEIYHIKGKKIELLFNRTDFNNESSVRRFSRQLRIIGVDEKLREMGIIDGDHVKIFDYEFEFVE